MRAFAAIAALASLAAAQPAPPSFDDLARKADDARTHDRLDEAVRLYQRALRLKPAWADGWWALGTIFYDSDRHTECAAAFTRFVALKPEVGPAHALLGLCEFGNANYDAALRHLFRAQELGFGDNPQMRPVALYHTVLALIVRRNFEKAVEQLAILVTLSQSPDQARSAAGLAALRRPILPAQIPEADRDLVDRMGAAVIAQLERRPDDAIRQYEAVLSAYPKAQWVRYSYGSLLLNSDPAKGLAMLKAELDLSPDAPPVLASLAYEYLKENDPASALPYAEKAVSRAPADFAARLAYGRALLDLDRVPEAVRELETAAKLGPDSPNTHFALANAYSRAGRAADAGRERKEFTRLRKLLDSGRK